MPPSSVLNNEHSWIIICGTFTFPDLGFLKYRLADPVDLAVQGVGLRPLDC